MAEPINDGYMMLLDELIIDGKTIGNISEEGIDWAGDKPTYNRLVAAQKRNGAVKKVLANPGTNLLTFQMIELIAQNIANLMGGTVVGEAWNAPANLATVEGVVSIKTGTGQTISIKKATVNAVVRGKLGNNGNLYLDTEVEFLTPTDGSSPYSINPTVAGLTVDQESLSFPAAGGSKVVRVSASGVISLSAAPAGFTLAQDGNFLVITAANNTGAAKSGSITLTLVSDGTKTATIALTQAAGA